MKWRIISPIEEVSLPEEKETVLSLEGPDAFNDVSIFCHVDGRKIIIGWFRRDGAFKMMAQSKEEQKRLQSVGFQLDDDKIRIK